ncbi:hypothetical protein [Enterococcus casseliflavus]|uniref:hypothetical protein n=1 Tax=Enterococcus casseliflavus TaxID=37734 RepID=UPI003D10B29E
MKYIITTDNEEQEWLDAYNGYFDKNYVMGQVIEEDEIEDLVRDVYQFNNVVACGHAIRLIKQEG